CLECELVNTLVNSGIKTAASVPQLMIVASCHHSLGRAVVWEASKTQCPSTVLPIPTCKSLRRSQLMKNEVEMQRMEAIQIKRVSGASKLNSLRPLYLACEYAWLMKYEIPDMQSIRNRIAKIQTMSLA